MTARIFVGTTQVDAIPANDRGFAYGDGLFETMRVHRGAVPWWDAHWARLTQGVRRLRMHAPERDLVEAQAAELFADAGDGVLKLIVTRGAGGRGYAALAEAVPTWMLSRHPLPTQHGDGVVLRWCDTRLAIQSVLAGLKHCNRLEQVLARGEWTSTDIHEGLMRSSEGDVVCATSANLFVLHDGRWRTPVIDRCGVAGICRAWLLQESGAEEVRLDVADVETAAAIVVCNAVRGILGVARLGDRTWSPHPAVAALRRRLAIANPAFTEIAEET
jgi:4-amino-4-deoxychorismate lyase